MGVWRGHTRYPSDCRGGGVSQLRVRQSPACMAGSFLRPDCGSSGGGLFSEDGVPHLTGRVVWVGLRNRREGAQTCRAGRFLGMECATFGGSGGAWRPLLDGACFLGRSGIECARFDE